MKKVGRFSPPFATRSPRSTKAPCCRSSPPSIRGSARRCSKRRQRLHAGDEENLRLWKEFLPPCLDVLEETYRRLGVTFDHTLGESFYHDRLAPIVNELIAQGVACESDGAICVFLEGQDVPMLIRKKDGAFLYATTDLATLRYRMEKWNPDARALRRRLPPEHALRASLRHGPADGNGRHRN